MTSEPTIGMRQVRYFLMAAQELNFTRAASKCNVSQPTLTRAILRLEDDMGGDLFRRERNLTHLTELGERIHPLLKKVLDNAEHASSLAKSIQSQNTVKLHLGFPQSVPLNPIAPHLLALTEAFPDFDFKVVRGGQIELAEMLKTGELDILFGGEPSETWDRFELWKLFHCQLKLTFRRDHVLAKKPLIRMEDLKGMSLLHRSYCPISNDMRRSLASHGVTLEAAPAFSCDEDLMAYLSSSTSLAYLPDSIDLTGDLVQRDLDFTDQGFDFHAITVAGRRRGAALTFLLEEFRAADWQNAMAA